MQCLFCCMWLISLNVGPLMLLQMVGFSFVFLSFLRLNNIPLCIYTTCSLSIHPLADVWGFFFTSRLLWIMLPWTWGCRHLSEILTSIPLDMYPKVITGSNGSFIFSFLSKFQTVYYCGSTSLHSHCQCTRVPFSLHPHQHDLFLNNSHLVGVTWYVTAVLISLVISDIEHFFN